MNLFGLKYRHRNPFVWEVATYAVRFILCHRLGGLGISIWIKREKIGSMSRFVIFNEE